jgi:lysophospholipase L1-like esterase
MVPLTLALSLLAAGAQPVVPETKPTLWIIGDSTVRVNTPGQQGWGDPIREHFDLDRIDVVNRAIGGRSSRTFRTEGRWQTVLDEARPGDFVLMQFGHNDGIAPDNPDRPRGTLRGTGDETVDIIHPHTKQPETVHTFGWYMRQYAIEAKDRGLTPILLSYVPRKPAQRFEIDAVPVDSSYARWTETVARETGSPFIDLHARVLASYAGLEPDEIKLRYFCEADNTHTSSGGAAHNAGIVVQGIRELEDLPLAQYLKQPNP